MYIIRAELYVIGSHFARKPFKNELSILIIPAMVNPLKSNKMSL